MLKSDLRNKFLFQRKQLNDSQYEKLNDLLLIQFQKEPFPFIHNVLSYFPLETTNEPDTFLITRYLKFLNPQIQIAYPKIMESYQMQAIIANEDTEYKPNKYGIMELENGAILEEKEIDLILIPLLAFDYNGNRVGYGKGFYDRYLAECNSNILKIGLSFYDTVDAITDTNSFDVKLTHCITTENVYAF